MLKCSEPAQGAKGIGLLCLIAGPWLTISGDVYATTVEGEAGLQCRRIADAHPPKPRSGNAEHARAGAQLGDLIASGIDPGVDGCGVMLE